MCMYTHALCTHVYAYVNACVNVSGTLEDSWAKASGSSSFVFFFFFFFFFYICNLGRTAPHSAYCSSRIFYHLALLSALLEAFIVL